MKFIKSITSKIKNFYLTLNRFLITAILLLVAEIFNIINTASATDTYGKYVLIFILGGVISCVAQIIHERFFPKMLHRILAASIALLITAGYYFVFINSGDLTTEKMVRSLVLIFAMFIAFIWLPIIKTKISFNESFMVVFKSFFISIFFALVIFGGVSLILAAINTLLFTIDSNAYSYASGVIFILFAPLYFLSLIPNYSKKEYNEYEREHMEKMTSYGKFLEILISYIFIPLASVFTFILLIYIVINIRGSFWKNSLLEPMLVSYSIVVILLYVLSSTIKNKFALWFRKIFPKVLIPIVLFQTISSVLKVGDAGIPFTRYYVIMYGLFALFAGILFSFTNIKKNFLIAPVLIGLMCISITPPMDSFSVGKRNQVNILESVLKENNMLNGDTITPNSNIPDKDKEKITSTVEYLTMMGYEDSISYLGMDFEMYMDFGTKFGFEPFYNYDIGFTPNYFNATLKSDNGTISISGYDTLTFTTVSTYAGNSETQMSFSNFEINGKNYELKFYGTSGASEIMLMDDSENELISFNLYEKMHNLKDSLMAENNNSEYLLTPENSIYFEENDLVSFKFILRNIYIESEGNTETMNVDGYVLVKIK